MNTMEYLLQILSSELSNNVFMIDGKIVVQLNDNTAVVLTESKA